MKRDIPVILGLVAISGSVITPQPVIAMFVTKTTDFAQQPPIGELGQQIGKITTISGVIQQAALGSKADNLDLVLSIKSVNNRLLPKPVTMRFQIFTTAKIV